MKYRYKRKISSELTQLFCEFLTSAVDFAYYHLMVGMIANSNHITLEQQIEKLDKLAPFFFVRIVTYLYFGWCLVHLYMKIFEEYGRTD